MVGEADRDGVLAELVARDLGLAAEILIPEENPGSLGSVRACIMRYPGGSG